MTAYIDRTIYRPNRKDSPPRASRRNIHKPWLDAGFTIEDWNKYKLTIKNRIYHTAPGRNTDGLWGHKVTGRTINGDGLWFPNEIEPAKIALYLSNLADNPMEGG